jgi:hypothetical protein
MQRVAIKESRLKSKLSETVVSRFRNTPAQSKENVPATDETNMKKHASFGRIPGYLTRMRVEKDLQEEAEAEEHRKSSIPEGCREMTEEERLSTIEEAQRKRSVILEDLKRLPLRIETLGQRRRKIELEHDLTELETTLDKLCQKTVLIRL